MEVVSSEVTVPVGAEKMPAHIARPASGGPYPAALPPVRGDRERDPAGLLGLPRGAQTARIHSHPKRARSLSNHDGNRALG